MSDKTGIEWTDATWNPIRGCSRVSPGCGGPGKAGGCYAEKIAARFSGPGMAFEGFAKRVNGEARWTGKMALVESALTLPLRWKKSRRIFVNSMSDLFHENLPDEAIDKVFAVMALCPQHTFQVLTKRPERMKRYMLDGQSAARRISKMHPTTLIHWPLPNVWLGTSVEDQARADERIPLLLETPAAKRFLSCEPLLGGLDIARWLLINWRCSSCSGYFTGRHKPTCPQCGAVGGWSGSHAFNGRALTAHPVVPPQHGKGIDWVIVGGESGTGARPMHPDWARSLRDQCQAAGVPFFFKQWGEWAPSEEPASEIQEDLELRNRGIFTDGAYLRRVGKKAAGRLLDGREWNEIPQP